MMPCGAAMTESLGRAPGLLIARINPTGHAQDARVALDFTSGLRGPFVTLTVDQWARLQQLARTIKWPAA